MSVIEFVSKSFDKIPGVSKNYWGNIDWTRNDQMENFIRVIWVLELTAILGLIWYLASRRRLEHLPEKKFVLFLMVMIAFLQFGVSFSNWRITTQGAESLVTSPGRYFIPNLASHIILTFIGLGMILRKDEFLGLILKFSLVLMLALNFHMIFNIIIPRFYL